MPMPQTEEVIRNPDAVVEVKCFRCRREAPLEKYVQEEQLPAPYETVAQTFLLCPHCGARKHSYYSTSTLRHYQAELTVALNKYKTSRKSEDWTVYRKAQKVYQGEYDRVQKKYLKLLGRRGA